MHRRRSPVDLPLRSAPTLPRDLHPAVRGRPVALTTATPASPMDAAGGGSVGLVVVGHRTALLRGECRLRVGCACAFARDGEDGAHAAELLPPLMTSRPRVSGVGPCPSPSPPPTGEVRRRASRTRQGTCPVRPGRSAAAATPLADGVGPTLSALRAAPREVALHDYALLVPLDLAATRTSASPPPPRGSRRDDGRFRGRRLGHFGGRSASLKAGRRGEPSSAALIFAGAVLRLDDERRTSSPCRSTFAGHALLLVPRAHDAPPRRSRARRHRGSGFVRWFRWRAARALAGARRSPRPAARERATVHTAKISTDASSSTERNIHTWGLRYNVPRVIPRAREHSDRFTPPP